MKNVCGFGFVLLVSVLLAAGSALATAKKESEQASGKVVSQRMSKREVHVLGKAENLSGTISMVNEKDDVLSLVGSNGVPYDFRLTAHTQFKIGGKTAKFADLKDEMNRRATVDFVPMSDGNLVNTLHVG